MDVGGPFFKFLFLWVESGTKDLGANGLFPIMREPTGSEFCHEFREGKCRKPFTVDRNPVVDKVIFETTKDPRNLDVVLNPSLGINKVIEAVVLEVLGIFWVISPLES